MILNDELAAFADGIMYLRDAEDKILIEPKEARKMFNKMLREVQKTSVATAALLSATDVCIEKTYGGAYDIYLNMPKPFKEQFLRQKEKLNHLKIAAWKLFGKDNVGIKIGSWKSEKLRRQTLDTNKWWSESPGIMVSNNRTSNDDEEL